MTYSSHRTGWLSERRPHDETARADHSNAQCLPRPQNDGEGPLISIGSWFDRIDPGTHRRIKGLRLVTAFGLAALLAIVPHISRGHAISLGPLLPVSRFGQACRKQRRHVMNPPATWLSYASPPVSARQVLSFSHRCSEQDFEWLVICTRGNLHQAAQHQDSKQNRRPHAHLPPRSQHIRAFFRSYFRSAASRL
jgi:hypothetical protein